MARRSTILCRMRRARVDDDARMRGARAGRSSDARRRVDRDASSSTRARDGRRRAAR